MEVDAAVAVANFSGSSVWSPGWGPARPLTYSAPQVARQAGWREQEAFRLGDGSHGGGIAGFIHLELEAGIGLHLGQKGGELCF
jgi:hypothetical protein